MHVAEPKNPIFGTIAEFDQADDLLAATKQAFSAGYRKMDAYTPFPVHGLADALGPEDHRLKWMIFLGGMAGAFGGVGLQWWVSAVAYPHNVGGKEHWSWPLFVPVAYECMILLASLTAFFGMLALNGLPKPYHPVFGAKRFELATQDKFFLCIESEDPKWDREETMSFLKSTKAADVSEVLNEDED